MRILRRIGSALKNFLYNEDRALASLGGADPQETISSEIGRHDKNPVVDLFADALDLIQRDHVENAVAHANELEAADDGKEQ